MMICMACRRRVDPNRSFCTRCGSSVFIDSAEASVTQSTELEPHQLSQVQAPPPQRALRPRAQAKRVAARPTPVVPSFPLGSLIRFAVFGFIVWKAAGFLLTIPEVRTFVDAVQRGEPAEVQPAIDSVRSTVTSAIQRALLSATDASSSAPEASPGTRSPAEPPPPEMTPPTAEETTANRPAGDAPRAGGSPLPRAVRKVPPVYTQQAMRAKVEGSVLLKALVKEDGTVSHITVVRSLDRRYGLDQQAIDALQQWVFEPAILNGHPTRAVVQVELTFALP